MRPVRLIALIAVVLGLSAGSARAQSLAVAAASDLQSALPIVAAQFEKATGKKVALTFGSSGNFFTQIQNGAPFDVFLSADVDYPTQLEKSGHAEPNSMFQYAKGRLVLWSRTDSGIDVRKGLAALGANSVRTIAIANPLHAPYGRAAVAALKHDGVYESVSRKLVLAENISQAAQFALLGSADTGLIAMSLALSTAMKSAGAYVEVPAQAYPPIQQAAVVVAASKQKALARQFIDFLKTPETRQTFRTFGFLLD